MGLVHDEDELEAYKYVLLNLGHVTGYMEWKRLPREWMDRNLPGYTQRQVNALMAEYVRGGGEVSQTIERRPEYTQWRFHYDLRMPITGRRVYIETVFVREPDPEDCVIYVVNMHDA
jgi:hypothetical protein